MITRRAGRKGEPDEYIQYNIKFRPYKTLCQRSGEHWIIYLVVGVGLKSSITVLGSFNLKEKMQAENAAEIAAKAIERVVEEANG